MPFIYESPTPRKPSPCCDADAKTESGPCCDKKTGVTTADPSKLCCDAAPGPSVEADASKPSTGCCG